VSDSSQILLSIIFGYLIFSACVAINKCERDNAVAKKIELEKCEAKCRPHPIKSRTPCICIINEEMR
jgi:hypothetical protein